MVSAEVGIGELMWREVTHVWARLGETRQGFLTNAGSWLPCWHRRVTTHRELMYRYSWWGGITHDQARYFYSF